MSQVAEIEVQEEPRTEAPYREVLKVEASPKSHLSRWILGLVVLAAIAGGVYWFIQSQGYESTDDAQIDGHLDSVSSRISGTVTYINPKVENNNQMVEAGTLLMVLTLAILKRSLNKPGPT